MISKVYLDSDIILDLLMAREPYCRAAGDLFSLIEKGELEGYVSPLIFANLFYILRKIKSGPEAIIILQKLKILLKVVDLNDKIISMALSSDFKDFEDAVQYYSAVENGVMVLLTRNKKDYTQVKIAIYSAEEFMKVRQIN